MPVAQRPVVFCRPFRPEFLLPAIQGLRAMRLPLATFWPRLRRYRLAALPFGALSFGGATVWRRYRLARYRLARYRLARYRLARYRLAAPRGATFV
jgi:hypothetical protein